MERPSVLRTARPTLIVIVAVLGFMLATAFNSNMRTLDARPRGAADLRSSDLAGFVRDMEDQRRDLRQRLARLREREARLQRLAAADSGTLRSLAQDLEAARAEAGLTPVRGSGLTIELSDAKSVPAGADPNDFLIHDFDLSAVVNALLAGDAEAVSVNGERIIATTAIRCAGNTVLVNATRLGSPYRITAVGEPGRLRDALDADRNARSVLGEYAERFGIGVVLTDETGLTVPAFRGAVRPIAAQPLEEGEQE